MVEGEVCRWTVVGGGGGRMGGREGGRERRAFRRWQTQGGLLAWSGSSSDALFCVRGQSVGAVHRQARQAADASTHPPEAAPGRLADHHALGRPFGVWAINHSSLPAAPRHHPFVYLG